MIKKLLICCVALIVFAVPKPAYAMPYYDKWDETQAASEAIGDTMMLILENYVGDEVTVEQLYAAAMQGMMNTLDPYSNYFNAQEFGQLMDDVMVSTYGVGIVYMENEDGLPEILRVVKGSPAEEAGLLQGDVITKVDGLSIAEMGMAEMEIYITNPEKETLDLTVDRMGTAITVSLTKVQFNLETVFVEDIQTLIDAAKADDGKTGYLRIEQVGEETSNELKASLAALKAQGVERLIIDLRGNPGGLVDVAVDICKQLVPEGVIFSYKEKDGQKETYRSYIQEAPFKNMVVLIDGNTASVAEIMASAMQDSGAATLVGETTYGKGVMQSIFQIDEAGGLSLTFAECFRRSGKPLNHVGVTPDVAVPLPPFVDYVFLDGEDNSPEIVNLKGILQYLGYTTGEMGTYYDATTMQAVKDFQATQDNLPANGKLTEDTLYALNMALYETLLETDPALTEAYKQITSK